MKRIIFLFLILIGSVMSTVAQYCIPSSGGYVDNYLKAVTTSGAITNLDYSATSNPGVYTLLPTKVSVLKGEDFTLNLVANSLGEYSIDNVFEDLRYCFAAIAIDWNQDQSFSNEEIQLLAGKTPPTNNVGGNYDVLNITKTISVPLDAANGDIRVRVFYSNAWLNNAQFQSKVCGGLDKGIVYDFDISVQSKSLVTYTQPTSGGSFVVMNGEDMVESNTQVDVGAELTIETTLEDDTYSLKAIKVNGEAIEGNTFIVSSSTTAIEVEFIQGAQLQYSLTGNGNLYITHDLDTLATDTILNKDVEIKVVATPQEGYKLTEFTVNGDDFLDQANSPIGFMITMDEGVDIFAKFEPITLEFSYSFNSERGTVTVAKNGNQINSGDLVEYNSELTVTLNPITHSFVSSILINEEEKVDELLTNSNVFTLSVVEATTMEVVFDAEKYTLTTDISDHGTVVITIDGDTVNNGDEIPYGALLEFEFSPNDGSEIHSLSINDEDYLSYVEDNYTDCTILGNVHVHVVFTTPPSSIINSFDQSIKAYVDADKIVIDGLNSDNRIEIIDITGKITHSIVAKSSKEFIQLSSTNKSGIWLIKIVGDNGNVVRKVIK